MATPITIFRGSTGLNTYKDPVRLFSQNGIQPLAVAGNVDITDSLRVSRRKGYTRRATGDFHSVFCDGGDCLVVSGSELCLLHPDYSHTAVAAVTPGHRMSYAQVNGKIYYCNGQEKGVVINGERSDWVKGPYVGPDTHRTLSDPPTGTLVAYYRTRMYVAQSNVLWYSEPAAHGAFDLVRGFIPYASDIRMVRPVDDGIYLSTETATFFLAGKTAKTFMQIKVADYPAIQWSDCGFTGSLIFDANGTTIIEGGRDKAAMWMSGQGICFGGASGQFYNLTLKTIASFPTGLTGSGIVYNGKFIGLINP